MEGGSKRTAALDVLLRLPGVIMLEMLFMNVITLKNWTILLDRDHQGSSWNIDIVLYITAWLLILLPRKTLAYFYCCVISCSSLVLSHYILRQMLIKCNILQSDDSLQLRVNPNVTEKDTGWAYIIAKQRRTVESCATVILGQCALVLFSCKIINAKPKALLFLSSPLYPWLTCMFSAAVLSDFVAISYTISSVALFLYYFQSFDIISLQVRLKIVWIKIQLIVRIFGWQGVLTWAQDEYQVQRLLVTCWFLRYLVQLFANLYNSINLKLSPTLFEDLELQLTDFSAGITLVLLLFVTGVQCLTTTINLFGLVCIIKDIVKFQYFITRSWLHWSFHNHPPDSVSGPLTGFIDGITLMIMTLYTDALNTKMEGRFILMIYILFTIVSSQFQSIFNIVDPILMTLATTHNGSVWKHMRTLLFALILLSISGLLSYISFFAMRSTFWVFIVAYNYVNTFSLMLGSLSIYCILMVDYLTLRGWTSLDDVMFYIRGACRAVEFCVTLCMCGYIMMTFYSEMSSCAGILMLAVYTYYCIVQRGGKGWRIWQMRRQAAQKVKSLPLASESELKSKNDDLCPICFQAMDSDVRVMHCNHLFHENCLKKWFYIQDKCPMCYAEFKTTVDKPEAELPE